MRSWLLRSLIVGVALGMCVSITHATVVPLSGMLMVKGGVSFNIALRTGGTVWTWGENSVGQLGDGTTTPSLMPTPVLCGDAAGDPDHCSSDGYLKGAVNVAAGSSAAMVLLDNGSVLYWGLNSRFNNAAASITPVYVPCGAADAAHCAGGVVTGVTKIAVGFSHALILLDDGAVLAWGTNNNGNLGNGQPGVSSATPVQVTGLTSGSGVITIAAAQNHTLALKADGTVVAWGVNAGGQLGDDHEPVQEHAGTSSLPRSAIRSGSEFCTTDGFLRGVVEVSVGNGISAARLSNSTVLAWGTNNVGQLGDGTTGGPQRTPANVCAMGAVAPCSVAQGNILQGVASLAGSSASGSMYARLPNGALLAWGTNSNGQLGDGTTTSRSTPIQVSSLGPGSGVIAVSAGDAHALALKANGTAFAWGSNGSGQLGNGTISASPSPVSTFGLGSGSGVTAISSRAQSTLALRSDGTVLAWGSNANGQLGDGTSDNRNTPVPVACRTGDVPGSAFCSSDGHLQGVTAVSAGNQNYALALLNDGTVLSWGNNGNGQLGDGSTNQRNRPDYVCAVAATPPCAPANGNVLQGVSAIAAGGSSSFVRTFAGEMVAWGNNNNGFLGDGMTNTQQEYTNQGSLPSRRCARDDVLFRCGLSSGRLGDQRRQQCSNGGDERRHGVVLGPEPGQPTRRRHRGESLPAGQCLRGRCDRTVQRGQWQCPSRDCRCRGSGNGAFALTTSGFMLGWGANGAAAIGDGTTENKSTPVHVCAVGATAPCSPALGNVLLGVASIGAGISTGYAILSDGAVLGWGANSSGQVGDGTLVSRLTPTGVVGLGSGSGVVQVSAGAAFATALKADGSVLAWGGNAVGELGDGTVYLANLTPAPVLFDDITPPTLTFGTPIPAVPNGANGWYVTDVAIPWTGADAHSALAATNPTSPLVLTAEGTAVSGSVTLCDIAGNCATFQSVSVKIDKTAPQATVTASPDLFWPPNKSLFQVQLNVTASDNLALTVQPIASLTVASE